jgi:hypothetical protein
MGNTGIIAEMQIKTSRESSDVVFDLDSQKAIYGSLRRTIESISSRQDLFKSLIRKLDKFFAIHKASYSIFDGKKQMVRVPVVYQRGETRSGIVISLAANKSLMRKVLRGANVYTEDFPKLMEGDLVERRILLLEDTSSLAIVPLRIDSIEVGTLNLASPAPFAFSIISSRLLDYLFEMVSIRFAQLSS